MGDHFGWWNPSCTLGRPLPHPTEHSLWCDHLSCSLWHGHSISKDMNRSSNSGDHVIWHLYTWQFPDKSPKRHHTRAPAPWSGKMNWKEEWVDEKILPWSHKAVNCYESGTCKSDCSMLFSFYFELDTDYSYLGRGMVDLSSCPDKMVNCGHVWGTVRGDISCRWGKL